MDSRAFGQCSLTFLYHMTATVPSTSVLAEFVSNVRDDIAMMIGVGLVKDSDAVFFQYLGEDQTPRALTVPTSGKPVFNLVNVRLVGIDVADDIGEFKSSKVNLMIESSAGNTIMLTSGLTTLWSQCLITCLMGLLNNYDMETPFTLNSWKGTSAMRPCFASIKVNGTKVTDNMMFEQVAEARGNRDKAGLEAVMRDAVSCLKAAINGQPVDVVIDDPQAITPGADF